MVALIFVLGNLLLCNANYIMDILVCTLIILLSILNKINTSVSICFEYNFLLLTTWTIFLLIGTMKANLSHHDLNFNCISLTHWGQVMHICVSKLTSIGSDNALWLGRHQVIIWTNAGILLIGPIGTNFSEILIEINTFLSKKMHLKMLSGKWPPFCFGLNV